MTNPDKFSGLMVGVAGIRGIVGKGLIPEIAARYAAAYGTLIGEGEVVVGLDGRPSGNMVFNAVSAGLQSVGCSILDIGIVPTPTIQMMMKIRGSNGGVAITASHNPQEWNALKFFASTSLFLDESEGAQLANIIEDSTIAYVNWDRLGSVTKYDGAVEDHIKAILDISLLDLAVIRRADFKVVVDCVNGAGSMIFPELLNELGCDVVKISCEPTGIFTRAAEPLPQNLGNLCGTVRETGADFGIAVDPDSDRLALVDETGNPVGEEYSLVIAADFVQRRKKGPMVCNVSTTRAMEDLAEKYGVELFRTKVGEVHVAKKMAGVDAVIGGEGNGGVILPEIHLGRDAPVGMVLAMQHLAQTNLTMSQLAAELPRYTIVKDKVGLVYIQADEVMERIEKEISYVDIDRTDGIKFIYPNSWIQIRPSNTEPILRIFAEAPREETAQELCRKVKGIIENMDSGVA